MFFIFKTVDELLHFCELYRVFVIKYIDNGFCKDRIRTHKPISNYLY